MQRHEYVDRFAEVDTSKNDEYDDPTDHAIYDREQKEKSNKNLRNIAKKIYKKTEKIDSLQSDVGILKEEYMELYNSLEDSEDSKEEEE